MRVGCVYKITARPRTYYIREYRSTQGEGEKGKGKRTKEATADARVVPVWWNRREARRGHGGFIQRRAVRRLLSDSSRRSQSRPSLSLPPLALLSVTPATKLDLSFPLSNLILPFLTVGSHRAHPRQHRRRRSRSTFPFPSLLPIYFPPRSETEPRAYFARRDTCVEMIQAARRPVVFVVHLPEPRWQRAEAVAVAASASAAVVAAAASIGRRPL